jgi:cytochrome P450
MIDWCNPTTPNLNSIHDYASHQVFPKLIKVPSSFGNNLVIAEHENWYRQRRVTAPVFSSKMFARLWINMRNIVEEMFHKWVERTDWHSALLS